MALLLKMGSTCKRKKAFEITSNHRPTLKEKTVACVSVSIYKTTSQIIIILTGQNLNKAELSACLFCFQQYILISFLTSVLFLKIVEIQIKHIRNKLIYRICSALFFSCLERHNSILTCA